MASKYQLETLQSDCRDVVALAILEHRGIALQNDPA
jgi:hypothetical protein